MKLFKRRKTKLVSFHTGTKGQKEHRDFIQWCNKCNVRIINAYTLYHDFDASHKPAYLNYVISYR